MNPRHKISRKNFAKWIIDNDITGDKIFFTDLKTFCLNGPLNQQINQIRKWIYNNQLSLEQRQKINNVLIESHYSLAHKQAFIFKNKHKYKCRNIQINDLKSASELGLIKASQKYNGNSSFYYYSCLHIHYELLNLLSQEE